MKMYIVENLSDLDYIKNKYFSNLNVKDYNGGKLAIFGSTYCRMMCHNCNGGCLTRYKQIYVKNITRKEKLNRILND